MDEGQGDREELPIFRQNEYTTFSVEKSTPQIWATSVIFMLLWADKSTCKMMHCTLQ
jgi:hypothetical protein